MDLQTAPTRQQIVNRLRDMLVSEFDRRVVETSRRLPRRCQHHVLHTLDRRKVFEEEPNPEYNRITKGPGLPVLQVIGLCGLSIDNSEEWNGTICEEPEDAQRCPYFNPKGDKQTLLTEFSRDVRDPEWIRTNLPGAYELMWVLWDYCPPPLPWWKRLLFWTKRITLEPQLPPFDVAKLLEPKE